MYLFKDETIPTALLFILLSLPLAVSLFLVVYAIRLIPGLRLKKAGGRLRSRLFLFFVMTVLFSSLPSTFISSRLISEITRTFFSMDVEKTIKDTRWFALDAWKFRLEALEQVSSSSKLVLALELEAQGLREEALDQLSSVHSELLAVQSFRRIDNQTWQEDRFTGEKSLHLTEAPSSKAGFLSRNEARDKDCIRYIRLVNDRSMLVVTFSLGKDFDKRIERLDHAELINDTVSSIRDRVDSITLFLYMLFSLPSLFIALVIALSLSDQVAKPVVELSKATAKVANGDFSVRIPSAPNDELGGLVAAFNMMVSELKITNDLSIRTEKISIWQDIAQRLAHEIKNPLTPIRLSAERLLRRWEKNPEGAAEILETSVRTIMQEVDNLNTLLAEFRSFSRLPPPCLSKNVLLSLIRETTNVFTLSYQDITIETDEVDPTITLMVDSRQFAQVMHNLILNAIDAMNEKGSITIRAARINKREKTFCRMTVRDSGIGISPEDIKELFNPYFTTKEQGTGLGLSIVERIISEHRGQIWCESAIGYGTSFYIDLPMETDE